MTIKHKSLTSLRLEQELQACKADIEKLTRKAATLEVQLELTGMMFEDPSKIDTNQLDMDVVLGGSVPSMLQDESLMSGEMDADESAYPVDPLLESDESLYPPDPLVSLHEMIDVDMDLDLDWEMRNY